MAQNHTDWDALGRNIEKIVDRAITAQDYQKLNQTIRQVVDKAVDVGGEAVRRAMEEKTQPAVSKPVPPAPKPAPLILYGSPTRVTTRGILKIVGGGLLSAFFLLLTLVALVLMLAGDGILSLLVSLTGLCAGGLLLSRGLRDLGLVSRFKTYKKLLGDRTHCALEKLARSVGKGEDFVRKELKKMITAGLFLEGHLDKEEQILITSNETYHYFEQSRLQLEQQQKQEAEERARPKPQPDPKQVQLQEVLDRGNAFIREIRRCNDAIPGEAVSGKIDRMETIVRRIFQRAQTHPEILPDLKKLMDYYLPMTVKLLSAYADMDAQPVQGPTIAASKQEIEETLDTLNLAYEKLLDSVFEDTALDVSSDITVLHTLLAQEGLTEDEFTKLRRENRHGR